MKLTDIVTGIDLAKLTKKTDTEWKLFKICNVRYRGEFPSGKAMDLSSNVLNHHCIILAD